MSTLSQPLIPFARFSKLALQSHNFLLATESQDDYLELAKNTYDAYEPKNESEAQALAEVTKLTWLTRRNEQTQAELQSDPDQSGGLKGMLKLLQILAKQWSAFTSRIKQLMAEITKARKAQQEAPKPTQDTAPKPSPFDEAQKLVLQKRIVDALTPKPRPESLRQFLLNGLTNVQTGGSVAIPSPSHPK